MDKIAIFYMIGQHGNPKWKEDFFDDQMNLLKECGLYDNIEFIDIFVNSDSKEYIPSEDLPDKVNNIVHFGYLEEEKPHSKNKYISFEQIQHRMWTFSQANPEYKLLLFHSLGVTHYRHQDTIESKYKWRKYLENLLIKNWRQSVELLDYYDCVGTEYIPTAAFKNQSIIIDAPHYQAHFWWANAKYLTKLNPLYYYRDLEWQPWLCEHWIGSGNPKAYNYHNTWMNQYFIDELVVPYDDIFNRTERHLRELRNEE